MFEIRIYDKDFNWLEVTTQASSVIFERSLYGISKFEIHIHPDNKGFKELCTRHNTIVINGDKFKSGIITDFKIEESASGVEATIYGFTGLLLTRQLN